MSIIRWILILAVSISVANGPAVTESQAPASSPPAAASPDWGSLLSLKPVESGFVRVTVYARYGRESVVIPRRDYRFQPAGRTYFLSPTGSDNATGSRDHPWRTPDNALQKLAPGDLLYFRAGIYPPFFVNRSGKAGSPIILSAYPGEMAQILQPAGWQKQHIHGATITLDAAHDVWINGFIVRGSLGRPDSPPKDTYGQNGITLSGGAGEGVWIINNVVSRCQHCGIKEMGHGGTHFVLEGNVCFDNGIDFHDHGFYIPSSDAVLRGNAAFASAGWGMHLYSHPSRLFVYDNVCFDNALDGIIVAGPRNTISFNVCADNRGGGVMLFRGDAISNTLVNNLLWDNVGGQVRMDNGGGRLGTPQGNILNHNLIFPREHWAVPPLLAAEVGDQNLFVVPRVVDAANHDYRLKPGSPGIGEASSIKLNGARAGANIGLFSATGFGQPQW